MSKKTNPKQRAAQKHKTSLPITPWQIGVVVGVMVLIVGVLWSKGGAESSDAALAGEPVLVTLPVDMPVDLPDTLPVAPPESPAEDAAVETALAPRADESPEAHLDRMIEEGHPVFAFFHSTTCYQCTEMIKVVDAVYPDFATEVALVRANVYDEANRSLLQRAGIRVIPTLIFIDRTGQGEGATGMMSAEQLRETLTGLAAGGTP